MEFERGRGFGWFVIHSLTSSYSSNILSTLCKRCINSSGSLLSSLLKARSKLSTFSFSALSISPAEIEIGEEVTVSVTVTNVGGQSGSYEVTLKVNNAVVDTARISLAAGTSQEVTFTTSKDTAGTHTVDINGKTATFVVKEAGTWWDNVIDNISTWKDNVVDWGDKLIDDIGHWWKNVIDNIGNWWDRVIGK